MAAISAAQNGAETLIADSNTVAGRKLLRSGRGRCNLSHTGSVEDFVKAYGPFGRFLQPSLKAFSPENLRSYFASQKLQTKAEKDGCVFPITNRAADVKRVLVMHARGLAVKFLYGKKVNAVSHKAGGFITHAQTDKILSKAVIIATGGVTWPFTGSTGDGYRFAEALGHSVIEPRPCLAPLITADDSLRPLANVSVPDVRLTTTVKGKKLTSQGPITFTPDGIEGPAAFDLSRLITDYLPNPGGPLSVSLDLMPHCDRSELGRQIKSLCQSAPKKELAGVLARLLPRQLMLHICGRLSPSGVLLAGQLVKTSIAASLI